MDVEKSASLQLRLIISAPSNVLLLELSQHLESLGKKIPNSGLYNSYSFSCFCSLVTYKCPVLFLPFIKVKHWVCCGPKAQQLSLSRYTFVYLVTFRTPPNALVPHKGVRGHFKHRISLGSLAAEREAGNEGGIATTCENY